MLRRIETTADGSATLYVPALDEHYHSVKGAYTESMHIFIETGLRQWQSLHPGQPVRLFEAGFGTGLNALLTLEEAEQKSLDVLYVSAELYPLAWEEVEPLHHTDNPSLKALHDAPWGKPVAITPHFTLLKLQADLSQMPFPSCDVVFYDAFAPEKQPEMWSREAFERLYATTNSGAVLTTYCSKGVIRRMLMDIGFEVERIAGPPNGKREILRAIKR